MAISAPALILGAVLVTAMIIWLISMIVRLTGDPRTRWHTPTPELTDEVRELKGADQLQEAILLLRTRTGMSRRAASRFVKKLWKEQNPSNEPN